MSDNVRTTVYLHKKLYDRAKEENLNVSGLVNEILEAYFYEASDYDIQVLRDEISRLDKEKSEINHQLTLKHTQLLGALSNEKLSQKSIRRLWLTVSHLIKQYWEGDKDFPTDAVNELANALELTPDDISAMWDYDLNYRHDHPFDDDYIEVHNDVYLLKERYLNDY